MDQSYSADGSNVLFDAGSSKVRIAEATNPAWARHLATAMNHWDKADVEA